MKGCPVLALERQTLSVGAAARIIASSTTGVVASSITMLDQGLAPRERSNLG
jgi:hypothetical protein